MLSVLLVTHDDGVRDAVARLAALAGAPVHMQSPGAAARAAWRSAGLVVLGPEVTAAPGVPRREGIVVVTEQAPDDALWQRAVAVGAQQVLTLPEGEARLLELMAAATEPSHARGAVVGIVGGCGGAGASTLAAALAVTAARTGAVILIDADPLGGGLDVLLGAEHRPGARWTDLTGTRGRLSAAALLEALPRVDGVALLSWDRGDVITLSVEAASSVIEAASRAVPAVVVDLPRAMDPAAEVCAAECDEVLLVVPTTVRAGAAAARVVRRLRTVAAVTGLVVCDAGAPRLAPDDVASALGLPVRAVLRRDRDVATAARQGRPPIARPRGPLHDCCRSVLAELAAPGRVAA
jgi:secretion/DNA translocation related CpaE-like protein